MRIAYLAYAPMPSHKASGVNIMKMCKAFAELGHEVGLFNPRFAPGTTASDLAKFYNIGRSVAFHRLPRPRNRVKGLIRYEPSYRRAINSFRADLLYIRDHGAKVYIPCGFKASKIFEAHLPHYDNPYIRALEQDPDLKQFVVISSALSDEYARHYPGLVSRLAVHHDGADLVTSPPQNATSFITPNAKAIQAAYIGNLYPGKGMELIQQLLPAAEFCHFHIIGGHGPELGYWKEQLVDFDNITFYGFNSPASVELMRSQFDCLLAPFQPQVMVGPSTNAAQWMSPLKIFEYMASGKPIIASDLPVIREVLEHEVTALLCKPDSSAEWLLALQKVRDQPRLCAQLADRSLQVLCSQFSWRERARRIIAGVSGEMQHSASLGLRPCG